jgi:hypothetical protein
MFFDPRAIFFLIVLVAVTGWVARGLMASWYRLRREDKSAGSMTDIEERLRKIEAATSGLIMDVTAIREKERFMARLQASSSSRETQAKQEMKEGDLSPMVTQSIPVIPRAGR